MIEKVFSETTAFLTKRLTSSQTAEAQQIFSAPKVQKYESSSEVNNEAQLSLSPLSNDHIALKILEQVELLKKNNLNLQEITQKDLSLLDETEDLVDASVVGMKGHNTKVSQYASKVWKRTGLYWTIIFLSLVLFFVCFLIIKVFPRLY